MKNASVILALLVSGLPALNAATQVRESITRNTVWTTGGSPYLVFGKIGVAPGVTLTIEPGVVVKFTTYVPKVSDTGYLEVRGRLLAKGTVDEPIYFTSLNDGSVGGHTGTGTPKRGDWDGILLDPAEVVFDPATNPPVGTLPSILEHCVVQYGRGIYVRGAGHSLRHCRISASFGGVIAQSGSGPTSIEDCELEDLYHALSLAQSASVQLVRTRISSCEDAMAWYGVVTVVGDGNTVINNINNGVKISGEIDRNTVWSRERLAGLGFAPQYIVEGSVRVEEQVTLTIGPGVTIKFNQPGNLWVRGRLHAKGTIEEPIYFTSLNDWSVGGRTGTGTPKREDWGGIVLDPAEFVFDPASIPPIWAPPSILEHCVVQYAYGILILAGTGASHTLRRCRISQCNFGVLVVDGFGELGLDWGIYTSIEDCRLEELDTALALKSEASVRLARTRINGCRDAMVMSGGACAVGGGEQCGDRQWKQRGTN